MASKAANSKLDSILNRHAQDIWSYVRDHSMSLDSERACAMIRDGFDEAMAEVRVMLDDASGQNAKLRDEVKELKRKMREMEGVQDEVVDLSTAKLSS